MVRKETWKDFSETRYKRNRDVMLKCCPLRSKPAVSSVVKIKVISDVLRSRTVLKTLCVLVCTG